MSTKNRDRLAQCVLDFTPRTWGGKREGAGRKRLTRKHDSAHRARPKLSRHHPTHVVMRVKKGLPKLRQGRAYRAIRKTLVRCLGDAAFRVCHLSIQGTHVHFLVEAASSNALSAGMHRLNILMAKALNRELGRRGKLFEFRYHSTQITNPRQARRSLAYVLRGSTRINFLSREPSTALCLSTPRTRLLRRAAAEGHVSDGSRDAQSPNEILCECRGYVFDDRERRINRSRATRGRMQAVAQQ